MFAKRGFDTNRLQEPAMQKKYVQSATARIDGKTTWADISQGIRQAAEETIGRKAATGPGPASQETQNTIMNNGMRNRGTASVQSGDDLPGP